VFCLNSLVLSYTLARISHHPSTTMAQWRGMAGFRGRGARRQGYSAHQRMDNDMARDGVRSTPKDLHQENVICGRIATWHHLICLGVGAYNAPYLVMTVCAAHQKIYTKKMSCTKVGCVVRTNTSARSPTAATQRRQTGNRSRIATRTSATGHCHKRVPTAAAAGRQDAGRHGLTGKPWRQPMPRPT